MFNLTRRDFLKTTLLGLIGSTQIPFIAGNLGLEEQYGRVLDYTILTFEEPSFDARKIFSYSRDDVVAITDIIHSDNGPRFNKIWYQINDSGYTHSGSIQPVRYQINHIITDLSNSGALAEVTVPFTDTYRGPGTIYSSAYRLYFETTYWVTHTIEGKDGDYWYRLVDDYYKIPYYALAKHLKILTPSDTSPISPDIPLNKKRIIVNLTDQLVAAYENEQPVFMSRASTGGKFRNGKNVTPEGIFTIFQKKPSRHMVGGQTGNDGYDYIGVPWVSYITHNGIAFHGAYWHNNFGYVRSHGCINMNPSAAKWIYRWSAPFTPHDQSEWTDEIGTSVLIIE